LKNKDILSNQYNKINYMADNDLQICNVLITAISKHGIKNRKAKTTS
jgi:hypothetical protein